MAGGGTFLTFGALTLAAGGALGIFNRFTGDLDALNDVADATGDSAIEAEIQAKGLTAPRVTPADIKESISAEFYFTADEGKDGAAAVEVWNAGEETFDAIDSLKLLTFCVLVLKNGFTVTGESACADPRNFNAEIGRRIARTHAVEKIWPLLGYELRTKLSGG